MISVPNRFHEVGKTEDTPGGFVFEVELLFQGLFITSPPPFNLFKSWNLLHLKLKAQNRREGWSGSSKVREIDDKPGAFPKSYTIITSTYFLLFFNPQHWLCILHACMRCGHQNKSNVLPLLKSRKFRVAEPILDHSVFSDYSLSRVLLYRDWQGCYSSLCPSQWSEQDAKTWT